MNRASTPRELAGLLPSAPPISRFSSARSERIEIVFKRPGRPTTKPPLVLVHGAWHGAWCWDMGFMDRLVSHGFECHAPSLVGHGGSEGGGRRFRHGIGRYVDDVRHVVSRLDRKPVLIGHSMGGFVVQKYLESDAAVAGILLASIPPTGILPFFARLIVKDPPGVARALCSLRCKPVIEGERRVTRLLFSPATPPDVKRHCAAMVEDEPFRAFVEMLLVVRAKPRKVSVPMHVVGGGGDALFPLREIEATARAYATAAHVFRDMAHDMMLDVGWEGVADHLARWIDGLTRRTTTGPASAGR